MNALDMKGFATLVFLYDNLVGIERLWFRHNVCYPMLHVCCVNVDRKARDGLRCSHAGARLRLPFACTCHVRDGPR